MNTVTRGASPAVVRALYSDDRPTPEAIVKCARCGAEMDFRQPDPLRIGRSMQRCTNTICPDRVLRPMPVRRP